MKSFKEIVSEVVTRGEVAPLTEDTTRALLAKAYDTIEKKIPELRGKRIEGRSDYSEGGYYLVWGAFGNKGLFPGAEVVEIVADMPSDMKFMDLKIKSGRLGPAVDIGQLRL